MNEEILNKYIELINKNYCSDCNELNCIDNFPHKKIANAIRELQQENQQLKSVLDEIRKYIKSHISYEKNSDGYAEPYLSGYAIKGSLQILDKVKE